MPEELLLIPGPTMLTPRVREVMARPQMGHVSAEFYEAFLEILKLTKDVFYAKKGFPIVFTGPGTAAMEASVVSLIEPGDKVLVPETGYFGRRFALINELHGAKVDVVKFELGKHADAAVLESRMRREKYKALCLTHVDTSCGVANPMKELVEIGRKNGVLTLVDAICSIGGCDLRFDDLGADVVFAASQKALAGPPGAALMVLSEKAIEAMRKRRTRIPSYYFNLLRWKEVMENPKIYLATPAVQVLLALREALLIVKEEGLRNRWRRHQLIAEGIRAGISKLNLDFVAEEGYRADTVTAFWVKNGNASKLQKTMRQVHGVQIARGLFENRDKMLRIGHFGNISPAQAAFALNALEMSMKALGYDARVGAAVEAAEPYFRELRKPIPSPRRIAEGSRSNS